jgi:hypothetical protein
MGTVAALSLFLAFQIPAECATVRDLKPGPFCFFASFVDHLAFMANAYQQERDSVKAAGQSSDLEAGIRTIAYWNMERRRVARRACAELSAFEVGDDSTAALITEGFCTVVEGMARGDSIAFAIALANLQEPNRESVGDRATRAAAHRQRAEELNRSLLTVSLFFTHLIVRTDPTTGRIGILALRPNQRRWLRTHLDSIAPKGSDAGIFGQVANTLAEWLADPKWKLSG